MRLNCGDICPKTGSYKVVNKDGKTVNTIYVGEGETMPPTQTSNSHNSVSDRAKGFQCKHQAHFHSHIGNANNYFWNVLPY